MRPLAVGASLFTAVVALAPTPPRDPSAPGRGPDRREFGRGQIRFDGHGPEWWAARWRRDHRKLVSLRARLHIHHGPIRRTVGPVEAIQLVFGSYAGEAVAVASCESHLSPWASNGQYQGMFQLGSHERQLYGHGSTPLEQTKAAYVYFVVSGRSWRPWSCKP